MDSFTFKSKINVINEWWIVKLPNEVSELLPSRGMNMAIVTIFDTKMLVPLEPDGIRGHWFNVNHNIRNIIEDELSVTLKLTKDWEEPKIAEDITAMISSSELISIWKGITVKGKWEWVRWIRSTNNLNTRKKRIVTMTSMLTEGKKRPCCFNSAKCSITEVSKNGILIV